MRDTEVLESALLLPDSRPIPVSERGTRHDRTRDETRSNAGGRSLVPRPAFANK